MSALRTSLRVLTWCLALAVVALPVVAVLNGWIGADRWPLSRLSVSGELQRVDPMRLREALLPHAERGFFAVRLADAQAELERLPWVERAEVRKRWPDVLEVRIHEHHPFARWGEDRLLSVQGRLFPVAGIEIPEDLPLLHGPDVRTAEVVELYNEAQAMFAQRGFAVRSLAMDERGSWSLALGNGTDVIVGSQEACLRLARFARLLPQLLDSRPLPLQQADLRYTNGFALSWGAVEPGPGTGDPGPGRSGASRIGSSADPFAPLQPPQSAFALAFPGPGSPVPGPGSSLISGYSS